MTLQEFVHMSAGACGGQKWVLELLKLKLKVVVICPMWMLGSEQTFFQKSSVCSYPLSCLSSPHPNFSKSMLYLILTLIHHTSLSLVISLTNICLYCTLSLVVYLLTSIEAQGATATNWLLWQLHRDDIKQLLLPSQFISYSGNSIDLTPGTESFCF